MLDERTQKSIQRLAKTRSEVAHLPTVKIPEAIRAKTGLGTDPGKPGAGGNSLVSPLTETSRTTYPTSSSDGLFVFYAPSSITFMDAAGMEVVLVLAQP